MKTLKERQAERAARKLENQAATDNTGTDRVGVLASQLAAVSQEAASLSPEDQAELRARLENNFEPTADYRPAETFPLSGIGVTNPFVVETAAGAQSGNGSGADALASAQAAAAWGTGAPADTAAPAADETLNDDGSAKTKAELKSILDERNVAYETDANLPTLQGLVKANPAPAQA